MRRFIVAFVCFAFVYGCSNDDPISTPSPTPIDSYILLTKWNTQPDAYWDYLQPSALALDAVGNVYVAVNVYAVADESRCIQKFTSDGVFIKEWGISLPWHEWPVSPGGIAVDMAGNVYVTTGETIQKFTSDGVFIKEWVSSAQGAMAIDKTGNVYVAGTTIQKFTPDGILIKEWNTIDFDNPYSIIHTKTPAYPNSIAIDSLGDVYINVVASDVEDRFKNDRCIQKFTSDGIFIEQIGLFSGDNAIIDPHRIAVDSTGCIYITYGYTSVEHGSGVRKITTKGSFVCEWKLEDWRNYGVTINANAGAIAVDRTGNVYVADTMNHSIQKFGPMP
jgi:tripartite motif-containing protein 71